MNPLNEPNSLVPVYRHLSFPALTAAYEFDFYRCLSFDPKFYGMTVSDLHAGNLRESKDGRYANLFPRDKVSYWSDSRATATAEVRKHGAGLDLITFHAYDDASSTFPTSGCREPLIVVDGRETGFAEILDKLDGGLGLSSDDESIIRRIDAEKPDCLMFESHAHKGGLNFVFFEKGFEKLSLREAMLRLESKDEATGKRRVNKKRICCAGTSDYSPYPEAYGRFFLPIAGAAMDEGYLATDEYLRRSEFRCHRPHEL